MRIFGESSSQRGRLQAQEITAPMTTAMIRRGPVSAETRDESFVQTSKYVRQAAWLDLQFHSKWRRGLLGLGRRVCNFCGETWGKQGCPERIKARRTFLRTAITAERERALADGLLTAVEAGLNPNSPASVPDIDPFALVGVTS
jgi:hypothetical protein